MQDDEKQKKDKLECNVSNEDKPGLDGTTWSDAADKVEEDLETDGQVDRADADELKKHSAA